jgi:nucleotide-binding universal stress UspA family protein
MSRIAVIVAPVDVTKSSVQGLEEAATWANELGSELHLLHVVPDPTTQAWAVEAFGVDFEAVANDWIQKAQPVVDALASQLPLPAARVKTRVQMGRPGEQIVAYAQEHEAGLIVMPSGEHGRIARLLLGSVADYVVRNATCPVLVLPAHAPAATEQREFTVPATGTMQPTAA